jgi:hypothetical protein
MATESPAQLSGLWVRHDERKEAPALATDRPSDMTEFESNGVRDRPVVGVGEVYDVK